MENIETVTITLDRFQSMEQTINELKERLFNKENGLVSYRKGFFYNTEIFDMTENEAFEKVINENNLLDAENRKLKEEIKALRNRRFVFRL